jgi:hypothetical protein
MKKIYFIFLFALLFSLSGIAQTKNVNIDSFWFTYAYRGLPSNPLDPIWFNYTIRVNATGTARNNLSIGNVINAVNIEGQKKVENLADASVIIELNLGDIIIVNSNINERKEESKDKSGRIDTRYFYKLVVNYSFESTYKITKDQKVIGGGTLCYRNTIETYQSEEYDNRKAASDFWRNNREVLLGDFYRNSAFKSSANLSNQASVAYGFTSRSGLRDVLKTMNEKKHDENVTFREAVNTVKTELEAMNPNVPLDKDKLTGVIDYFKSLPAKYSDPKSKADQHIRYAAYFNLCKIYYYLDEPENVQQYGDLITANGYDDKDGAKLNKAASELQAVFDKTGMHTRHFVPEEYFNNAQ